METKNGGFKPVEAAFGVWLRSFRDSWFVPMTAAGADWQARPIERAMALVPGRMIDDVEGMLGAWRRNQNDPARAGTSAFLPVVLAAVAKEIQPMADDAGRQMTRPIPMIFPEDPLARWFRIKTIRQTKRAQVVIIAADKETANDIAAQFLARFHDTEGTFFQYPVTFGGFSTSWSVRVVVDDAMAMDDMPEQNSLTILHIDMKLEATIPLFSAPAEGEPNDGSPGTPGYPEGGLSEITLTVVDPPDGASGLAGLPGAILIDTQDEA